METENELTVDQMEELADEITKSDFPFSKVKKIVKLDPSVSLLDFCLVFDSDFTSISRSC